MQIYPQTVASRINIIEVFESEDTIVKIIESDWPDRFHAITENGTTMKIKYEILFIDEIKKKYKFDPLEIFAYHNDEHII